MGLQVSVCGIVAKAGWEPYAWETRFDHKDLAEPDLAVAIEFVRQDVHTEGLANGNAICQLLAARVHPGRITNHTGFDFADLEVRPDAELDRWPVEQTWTVCGVHLDNGEPYSAPWRAYGPAMAYLAAWEAQRNEGRTLLLAGVHLGDTDEMARATGYTDTQIDALRFPYADPACDTAEEMMSVMREWAPTPTEI